MITLDGSVPNPTSPREVGRPVSSMSSWRNGENTSILSSTTFSSKKVSTLAPNSLKRFTSVNQERGKRSPSRLTLIQSSFRDSSPSSNSLLKWRNKSSSQENQ